MRVLEPMLVQTGGTILAGRIALARYILSSFDGAEDGASIWEVHTTTFIIILERRVSPCLWEFWEWILRVCRHFIEHSALKTRLS